jgi:hypothetical protein
MWSLISQFVYSGRETKWYFLNHFVYGLLIILSTIYCYLRLDYVRSYKTNDKVQVSNHLSP